METIDKLERELYTLETQILRTEEHAYIKLDSLKEQAQFLRDVIYQLRQSDN